MLWLCPVIRAIVSMTLARGGSSAVLRILPTESSVSCCKHNIRSGMARISAKAMSLFSCRDAPHMPFNAQGFGSWRAPGPTGAPASLPARAWLAPVRPHRPRRRSPRGAARGAWQCRASPPALAAPRPGARSSPARGPQRRVAAIAAIASRSLSLLARSWGERDGWPLL